MSMNYGQQEPQRPQQLWQGQGQPSDQAKKKPWFLGIRGLFAVGAITGIVLILSSFMMFVAQSSSMHSTVTTIAHSVPTSPPTQPISAIATPNTLTTPQSIHYPPTTVADLRGLAAKGLVSAIHEFHSESVGLTGVCPQPKREVTVDPSVTGQQLAEDLLAYFYTQQLGSPCGSIVFAYHDQGEANDVYTAGRISFDVTDSRGANNVDPNANNLKHRLTLDVGGAYTNQEYVITY